MSQGCLKESIRILGLRLQAGLIMGSELKAYSGDPIYWALEDSHIKR